MQSVPLGIMTDRCDWVPLTGTRTTALWLKGQHTKLPRFTVLSLGASSVCSHCLRYRRGKMSLPRFCPREASGVVRRWIESRNMALWVGSRECLERISSWVCPTSQWASPQTDPVKVFLVLPHINHFLSLPLHPDPCWAFLLVSFTVAVSKVSADCLMSLL